MLEIFTVLLAPTEILMISCFLELFKRIVCVWIETVDLDCTILDHRQKEEVELVLQIQNLLLHQVQLHISCCSSSLGNVFKSLVLQLGQVPFHQSTLV